MKRIAAMAATAAIVMSTAAPGQTPVGGAGAAPFSPGKNVPMTPPPKAPTGGAGSAPSTAAAPKVQGTPAPASSASGASQGAKQGGAKMPISADMKMQAEFQRDGAFAEMVRPGAGGQIQDAWDKAEPDQGFRVHKLCRNCVYKVGTRELMVTTVVLPDDAVITSIDPGDDVGFVTKIKAGTTNKFTVRPTSWGIDTNLNVNTKSGAVYPFYVRAETINSSNVPDLVFKIDGRERPQTIEVVPEVEQGQKGVGDGAKPAMGKMGPAAQAPKKDFVRNRPVDVSKFYGWDDYRLWGDDELKPETVWRDDVFTYIKYGKKWDGMELSTGYVTIDEYDELVNSRVEGTVFIIETVAPLITLKNGKKYLCIQFTGSPS